MIISNQQLIYLIQFANHYLEILQESKYKNLVASILDEIIDQQSKELKEIQ